MSIVKVEWKLERSKTMSEVATIYAFKTAEGGWRVAGSRVSLDSIVHAYWEGESPEAIVEDFPTLTAEQVYGAITFYLRNRKEIDGYLAGTEEKWKELKEESEAKLGPLLERLRQSRRPTVEE